MPADKIAQLNDRFRKGDPAILGKSFVTTGIIQLLTEQNIPIDIVAPIEIKPDMMTAYCSHKARCHRKNTAINYLSVAKYLGSFTPPSISRQPSEILRKIFIQHMNLAA